MEYLFTEFIEFISGMFVTWLLISVTFLAPPYSLAPKGPSFIRSELFCFFIYQTNLRHLNLSSVELVYELLSSYSIEKVFRMH